MKPWFLRFHRWLALAFSLPLAVVVVTGLILSFEPWLATRAIQPGTLTTEKMQALLRQHDPSGAARMVAYRAYDGTISIGAGRGGGTTIDLATGAVKPAPSGLAVLLGTSRRMHETLLLDATWLVIASTAVMLVLALLGVLLGLPTIRNTLSGWHKAMSWGLLPLLVLSPLTGLLMSAGISFTGAPSGPPQGRQGGAQMTLAEAVAVVGKEADLSTLVWLRPQGGRVLARLNEGGEYRVYAVSRAGMTATPRNWPRLWHEGNFAGVWSSLMNIVISFALVGLMITGVWIWARRKFRRRNPRQRLAPA